MGCVFHAVNSETSFKSLIQSIGLETYRLFDKGEENKIYKISQNCFSCVVSEADWANTKKQFEDMKVFIKKNENKLKLIKDKIEKIDWKFDVPIESRLGKNIAVQCDYIDVELIKLCSELDIGIEISYYPKQKNKESLWKRIIRKFRLTTAST